MRLVRLACLLSLIIGGCGGATTSLTSASAAAPSGTPVVSAAASASVAASAAPSATASPVVFVSPFYAYSVTLPQGWIATPARTKWDGQGSPGSDDPTIDLFSGPRPAAVFAFAGPTKSLLEAHVNDVIARNATFHGDTCPPVPEVTEPIMVGPEAGVVLRYNCGILINLAVTVHAGVGYEFVMRDPDVAAAVTQTDKTLFQTILQTVTFSP